MVPLNSLAHRTPMVAHCEWGALCTRRRAHRPSLLLRLTNRIVRGRSAPVNRSGIDSGISVRPLEAPANPNAHQFPYIALNLAALRKIISRCHAILASGLVFGSLSIRRNSSFRCSAFSSPLPMSHCLPALGLTHVQFCTDETWGGVVASTW
jgi:hypothetical protein